MAEALGFFFFIGTATENTESIRTISGRCKTFPPTPLYT